MKLKGEIIYAFSQELKALFADGSVTILVKTDNKNNQQPTYKLPLVEIDMQPGGDSGEFLGGLTMEDYHLSLSVYNYQQGTPEDTTDYSATLIDIVDIVRQKFVNFAVFLAPEMAAAFAAYGMRMTYSGSGEAHPLEHADGLADGTAIRFSVVAFDNTVAGSQYKTVFNQGTPLPPSDSVVEGIEVWGIREW